MSIAKCHSEKFTCCLLSVDGPGAFSFWNKGFLKARWFALSAAVALTLSPRASAAPSTADDPPLTEFATRVSELVRQAAAVAPAGVARKSGAREPEAALQQLVGQTEADVHVHLRPGNQTVRQLRGSALAPARKGVAPLVATDSHERVARKFFATHHGLMRLMDPDHELALVQNQRDELGYQHLQFRQEYQGLPVWPAGVKTHFDPAGNMTVLEGAYVPTPEMRSLTPALGAQEAVTRALSLIRQTPNTFATDPELIVYAPGDRPARLAWKFGLTVSLREAWLLVVDAQDGNVLHQSSRVCDGQVSGTGVDLFGKTLPVHAWQQNDSYYLADTSKPSYNAAFNPVDDPHGVITVLDANGVGTDGALQAGRIVTATSAELWNNPAAVSAAFNLSESYDYYLDRHGRNSLDGQGGSITALVRVGFYNNASWHGDLRVIFIGYGAGSPWAGSLDMVGHELTHGVTDNTAGLIYANQSGALDEAFADIFGEMIEARTRGQNDWILGSQFDLPLRNMKNPGSLYSSTTFRPYPSKMSEYADLPNTADYDWGGVHCNSSIINHTFYLLAEGLDGAVGLRKAESIFYRCLTQHLFAQSEFVDCRLGCITSAEELFGKDSTEARRTAQAFDRVEILAAPATPAPTPVPTVSGPDSLLFVYHDFWAGGYNLGRREPGKSDPDNGIILTAGVNLARPAVTGDGSVALFVSSDFDLCAINTADSDSRQCLGFAGLVHSMAISPDANLAAFVLTNKQTGLPDDKITLVDLSAKKSSIYNLVAPTADGVAVDTVLYADSMTFSTDGTTLIYDALSQLKFGNGPTVQRWSIYALHLDTGHTTILVPPQDGIDTGNPAVGRAGNRYLTYDALSQASNVSSIMIMDLFTGQAAEVATAPGGFANPCFFGDEGGVLYSAADPNAFITGRSLLKQNLATDRLHKQGDPALFYQDANLGVIYRRGNFQATNALPTVSLALSADSVPAQGSVTLTATAMDADGTITRVEFYDGSTKLGQTEAAPYTFLWQQVPAGNHLLIARAVDNVGGSKDSSPRFLTVTGSGSGNKPPTVSLQISADQITLPASVTLSATASDPDGSIARVVFYDTSTRLGQADAAPYSFVWRTASPGNHLVTARAVDNAGAETVSSPRLLTVTGTADPVPTVTLRLSADKISAHGDVTLTATAVNLSGNIVRMEFYDASAKIGEASTAPYTLVWKDVPAGNHLLTARAIDNLGAETDSPQQTLKVGANALPAVSLSLSADRIAAQSSVTLTATASDSDGNIIRVEFYADSTKLGEAKVAPYTFVWQNVSAGNHLIKARAVDNWGAETDSSPRLLTVSGTPSPSGDQPKLSIQATAPDTVRLTVSGPPGDYIIAMSEDLKTWVDIYPVTVEASGVGTVDDSGGPLHYSRLFYRVRRDQ